MYNGFNFLWKSCSSGQSKLVFQLYMVLSFAEQLICSESKKPEGDWESDILDQITVTRVLTIDSCT